METTKSHNNSIDVIKGFGILCVIIGHVLLGSLNDNPLRFVIYSFHMPLFFFVSGWLINPQKLANFSFRDCMVKYAKRMLLWWFAAWLVYTLIVNHFNLSLIIIAKSIVFPYYHLWFIPGLFTCIVMVWIMTRFFNVSLVNTLVVMLVLGFTQTILMESGSITNSSFIRHYNIIFFCLGIMCKRLNISVLIQGGHAVALYLALTMLIWILTPDDTQMLIFPILLAMMVFVLTPIIRHDTLRPSRCLSFIGKNSLQIYLWHVLPVMALKSIFVNNKICYYIASIGMLAALLCVVIHITKPYSSND